MEEVLYDGSADLSWFFRYCLAAGMKDPKRYAEFMRGSREEAAHIYWQDAALYDEICGPFVPAELKRDAKKLHDQWVRNQAWNKFDRNGIRCRRD